MHTLIQPLFIILLFVLVRSADLAICAGIARDTVRIICYGLVAVLALFAVVITLLGA